MPDVRLTAPHAPTVPFVRRFHGDEVEDHFAWMADKSDQRLLDYLDAENAYTDAMTTDQACLRDEIVADIEARTQQTDMSVPIYARHLSGDAFWYFSRTKEGDDYGRHCRVPAASRDDMPDVDAASTLPGEQVLLDVQAMAAGEEFFSLGWSEMSPSGRLLAYSVDTSGDEVYDLYVIDVATGEVVDGPLPGIGAGGTWLRDDALLYCRVDDSWRPYQVWRHRLGEPEASDRLVFTEPDDRFWLGVDGSRDYRWALIELGSKLTSETWLLDASDPDAEPRCIAPREEGIDYAVEVAPDGLYIIHNEHHPQFELAWAPLDATSRDQWTPLVPPADNRRLNSVTVYDRALVVTHRTDGQAGIAVIPRNPDNTLGDWQELEFDEPLYDVDAEAEPDLGSDRFRISYESMVTPPQLIEYNLETGERRLLREMPVLPHPTRGAYHPDDYVQERVWATAPDGVRVPMSVVRHKDTPLDGTAPAVLYGYGAYEISMPPTFGVSRLSLLDRGFVYAVAHVRGGGDLGRPWYDDGKMLHKRNTFTDFIACARELVASDYTSADRLVAEGGSAGGLLMGALATMAPDAVAGIHLSVPFVDALTTILDPELPLTVTEWEEWGDPLHDPEVYAYMRGYSPYENLRPGPYPAMLVTTSLNDTRVEVTEPAKWTARLREVATNGPDRPILLHTEMVAGHGGVSGRYAAWRDRAFELAWIISVAGAHQTVV